MNQCNIDRVCNEMFQRTLYTDHWYSDLLNLGSPDHPHQKDLETTGLEVTLGAQEKWGRQKSDSAEGCITGWVTTVGN